jgi:hypothetical protein
MAKSFRKILCCIACVVAAFGAATTAAAGGTLRCGNRLVSVGDNKAEVTIKCGPPAWEDEWTDEIIDNVNTADEVRFSVDRERWVYNFGPNSFLRFLLFENGKLVSIATGGYGYDQAHPSVKPCDGDEITPGLTQFEILQRCGDPAFKDSRQEERLANSGKQSKRLTITRIDEWTYNFGPNKFLRILKFENGRLVDIETGDRGF